MAARDECTFGGAAGAATQGLLFVLALASLVYKRHTESPRRSVTVWGYDVSKQFASSLAAHLSGLLWSHALAGADASECAYYFVVFTLDTTLGVAISLALHRRVVDAARSVAAQHAPPGPLLERAAGGLPWFHALARSGYYGEPPSARTWAQQLAAWCGCVVAARTACGVLVLVLRPLLRALPRAIDALFAGAPRAELAIVMVLWPLCLNLGQAWIQDAHLKGAARADGMPGSPAAGCYVRSGSGKSSFAFSLDPVAEARPSQEGMAWDSDSERGRMSTGALPLGVPHAEAARPAGHSTPSSPGAYRGDS